MRILQALFFPPEQPGGVSSMVPFMLDRFNKRGWEMELFSLPKRVRGKGAGEIRFSTFDWEPYAGHPVVDKYIQTMKDYIWWTKMRIKSTYDLIHAHHPITGLVMKQLFPDTPLIMTVHSSYERELVLNGKIPADGPEHAFLTSIYRELEEKADQLITVSNSFKQYLSEYVQEPERIGVIPNGFDEKRFRPVHHENQVPQLITVCRLVPAKGLDTLLQACAELKRQGQPFVLHLIGDGPIRTELEELAQQLGIYEETIFYGYMLHPEDFMPFFDVFVLPSRAEAFGSVFAEAALCGLAVVGTNVGGIAEQIEHGTNGLLVPVNDVQALATALEKVIGDPMYRYQLSRVALEKALKTYSMTHVVQQLRNVYRTYRKAPPAE
ncbi:glycosyltransferase family 4 protein [Paenibacillus sp. MZ04-78.2]|uniref:glycosyltransferase family 4 protein n=1 Tax=Paenibacillus sp. MZ04-78.2 TaxID=2962034 RepID=UPI0020B82373|nr:glycosyltransferase family 4 protein [Paenibacillus sp. MZ04-78.2]MCP3775094.1 glycosyltransferase family 4 protein [Paenibacillus sp. MZ04-78.2]